jgi:gamma-glutamyltranspeptidase/glutathione hydrolase
MRSHLLALVAAISLVGGCTGAATAADPRASGMVSAADPRAAAAGAEILRKGGSAADAAIATLLVLNLVEPQSSGIGGGGYLVYSEPGRDPQTYDGRETAPHAATGTWFFKDGQPMAFSDAQPGGKSVGVPGNVRMMAMAHQRYGKLPWGDLFRPAIHLARNGFSITPRLHNALAKYPATGALSAEARALFYDSAGQPKAVGTLVKNPAFADFLESIARLGADSFYVGPNAQAIVAAVSGAPRNPAPMTTGDVASYEARPRSPACGTYRVYQICGMGPSSSGGFTVYATLKQLERFDLARFGPHSPKAWHLIAESERLAYADRDYYLADPEYQRVPMDGLMDSRYLSQRSALLSADKTMANASFGAPPGGDMLVCPRVTQPERGTSHFVAVDRWGNVASETSTIESAFGSGLMVNGYYLNNELTDFSFSPNSHDCPVANRVEGGKRPRSSMSPTIVYDARGNVVLAVGAAGGSTIPAQVIKTIIGVLDFHLTAQQAIALPVIFAPDATVFIESGTFLEAMIPQLRALGHADIRTIPSNAFKANAIERRNGRWMGAADPRSEGAAVAEK